MILGYLYGANANYAASDNTYDSIGLFDQVKVIWDGRGRDVIDLSNSPSSVTIDLRPGRFCTAHATGLENIAIAYDTFIENAVGSDFSDTLVSNQADNILSGGLGGDIFVFLQDWGNGRILDFTRGEDKLSFTQMGLGFSDVQITSSSGDTVIKYGDSALTLEGVSSLDASDFEAP